MWFTSSQAVGRITVNGVVTVYPVGNDPSLPLGDISLGRDGNLWFSEYRALRHISPDGRTIVNVPLPTSSSPDSVVSGPDGNIWFTDSGLNAIVRVNVAGSIRQFPMPRRNAFPHGIAVGADGRIWFGEGQRVASIGVKVPEVTFSGRVLIYQNVSTQSVTVTNTGDANLTIAGVTVTGADQSAFALVDDSCAGKSLAPGAKCEVAVSHAAAGPAGVVQSALLEVADNGTASPQRVSLVAQLRSCELPVMVSGQDTGQGAMLDTTTGRETYAPGGSFTTVASPARVGTVTAPVLMGDSAGYYDRPAARWLPVPSADWVSPDGSRYAYIAYDDPGTSRDLRIVDIATGRETILPLAPGFWSVVAFTDRGVYVHQAYEGIAPGLWLVDAGTGSMRQVLDSGAVDLVEGTTAWVGDFNPADTLPQWGIGGGSNEIGSRDLVSGATRTWLYMPGTQMYVVATYDGAPVVAVNDQTSGQVIVMTAPSQPNPVELPFTYDDSPTLSGFVSDPQGLWIGSLDGVYLWTSRTGGILVSTVAAVPAGTCA